MKKLLRATPRTKPLYELHTLPSETSYRHLNHGTVPCNRSIHHTHRYDRPLIRRMHPSRDGQSRCDPTSRVFFRLSIWLALFLTSHLFTPLTIQAQELNPQHRIWIKRVNEGDSVTFKFWFRESNELRFIQDGKELKRVKFEDGQTRYFSFQEWHRFPMVRFCNENGILNMWFLNRDTFEEFECSGQEVQITI